MSLPNLSRAFVTGGSVGVAAVTPINDYVYKSFSGAFAPNPTKYAGDADYRQAWDKAIAAHFAQFHVNPSVGVGSDAAIFQRMIQSNMTTDPMISLLGRLPPILGLNEAPGFEGHYGYDPHAYPRAIVNGKVFYSMWQPKVYTGNERRESYQMQDWADGPWIVEQVKLGNILPYTLNGENGFLAAPSVVNDSRFNVTWTGEQYRDNTNFNKISPQTIVSVVSTVVGFVFPPAAPFTTALNAALAASDAIKTGNVLELAGAVLSIPGMPPVTIPGTADIVGGNAALTARNVVGAANVVQGVSSGNVIQSILGVTALPGIDAMVSNAIDSTKSYMGVGNNPTGIAAEQAPAPMRDVTPTPVPIAQSFSVAPPTQIDQLISQSSSSSTFTPTYTAAPNTPIPSTVPNVTGVLSIDQAIAAANPTLATMAPFTPIPVSNVPVVTGVANIDQVIATANPTGIDISPTSAVASPVNTVQAKADTSPVIPKTTTDQASILKSVTAALPVIGGVASAAGSVATLANRLFTPTQTPTGTVYNSNMPPGTTYQQGVDSLLSGKVSDWFLPIGVLVGAYFMAQ